MSSYYLNAHHVDFHEWAMQGKSRPTIVTALASKGVATNKYSIDTEDTITLSVKWENIGRSDLLIGGGKQLPQVMMKGTLAARRVGGNSLCRGYEISTKPLTVSCMPSGPQQMAAWALVCTRPRGRHQSLMSTPNNGSSTWGR